MSKRSRVLIAAIPAILCMAMIFCFSSENADISSNTSGTLITKLLTLFRPGFSDLAPETQNDMIAALQFWVRKGAHFSVYTLLGALWMLPVSRCTVYPKRRAVWSWLFATAYAATDELHQYFVPGRSCELRDVCIDSAGALLGVLIVSLISAVIQRKRAR